MEEKVTRIPPFEYIHVLDRNANICRLEIGPNIFVRKDHEEVVTGPSKMIRLQPMQSCRISNPVIMNSENNLIMTDFGEAKLHHGYEEIRYAENYPEPFPLYPGESLKGSISKYTIVGPNEALWIVALQGFEDKELNVERSAGDEWLVLGVCTYKPVIEAKVVKRVKAEVIKQGTALKLKARRDTKDKYGEVRRAGEEWLIREPGGYLPSVDEECLDIVKGLILTEKTAFQLRAINSFRDIYGEERRAGEQWLVTMAMGELHICDVYEILMQVVEVTTLTNRQYCRILHYMDPKTQQNNYGAKIIRKGECSFFLQPEEEIVEGIKEIIVLQEDEALLLLAKRGFKDEAGERHSGGERWMFIGPGEYIPPLEVEIVEQRKSIPLDDNEGIYVRDTKTGEVFMVTGQNYMLKTTEELWEKYIEPEVDNLLALQATGQVISQVVMKEGKRVYDDVDITHYKRDKSRVITFRAPHNTAIQLFDFKTKVSRVVFGPDLVLMTPYEEISVLTLSGGQPKVEGMLKNLALLLGPDFMTDIIVVETSNHAKLHIKLAYSTFFDVDKTDQESAKKCFCVPDFKGDCCKAMASRIRGSVSGVSFDDFHKHSTEIIQNSVFKKDQEGVYLPFRFPSNNLVITAVDIQSIEPVDPETTKSLEKSVNLSIDITARSVEMKSEHESKLLTQQHKGERERDRITDMIEAEKQRAILLALEAQSLSSRKVGEAMANANAKAESIRIKGMGYIYIYIYNIYRGGTSETSRVRNAGSKNPI